jgi:energy-coupling factor transport system ATP-binding protein
MVFSGLNLSVRRGERLAILGPSEAGKSTLALCLNGLIPRMVKGDFQGRVELAGQPLTGRRPRQVAAAAGLLFQDFEAQLFCSRVDAEVAFGPENLALPRDEIRRRLKQALGLVGLAGLEHRDPVTLSGGQKQLLALAAVLALEPQVLILDEPTTDLDPLRVEDLLAALDRLCRDRDLTLILLGEDFRLARHATRVVLLHQGAIAADGPAARIACQVELCRRLGLRPPELPALFHDLGESRLPLTLAEAEAFARAANWRPREPLVAEPPPPPGPEVISLEEVSFAYPGGPPVLDRVSLRFTQGELAAILGPNGSGKTTLLLLLRGLLKPSAGRLRQAPGLRVGYVFQNPDYQIFAEEVWEEVAVGPRLLKLPAAEVERRVSRALEQVQLLNYAREDPFSLTKGQRQRLAVAAVLALAPQVIILDEPTTGLDCREQEGLFGLIRELNSQGHTIIMATHALWAAATYARRLIVVNQGRVALDGPARKVLAQEETLSRCGLTPPEVAALSRRLGFFALTAEEFSRAVGRERG